MIRLLFVIDRPGWAFDRISNALMTYGDERPFEIIPFFLKGNQEGLADACNNADIIFFIHWSLVLRQRATLKWRLGQRRFENQKLKTLDFVDLSKSLVGIHAHDDWDDRCSRPDLLVSPPPNLIEALAEFRAVNTVSTRLYHLFHGAGLSKLTYTPNGVDISTFNPTHPLGTGTKLKVGCTGTPKRDWNKGLTEFIQPLAELPFIDMRLGVLDKGRRIPYSEMPEYYNNLDVYVCASASEGFSLSVLEASASGRPVVSTRVGGSEDLIENGINGFLVDREVNAIAEKLQYLHENRDKLTDLGNAGRARIEKNWSWEIRAKAWLDFIEQNL